MDSVDDAIEKAEYEGRDEAVEDLEEAREHLENERVKPAINILLQSEITDGLKGVDDLF